MNRSRFRPRRTLGLVLGGALCGLCLAAAAVGTARLVAAPITPAGLLIGLIPLAGLAAGAAFAYRTAGLVTGVYRLDRNGFRLQWGWALEEIPWSAVRVLQPLQDAGRAIRPRLGLWWPGCVVGSAQVHDLGKVEFFAADLDRRAFLLSTVDRHLVISPNRPAEFFEAYVQATRQGVLENVPSRSVRPDFLAARVWADPLARGLLWAGLLTPLGLIAFLALRSAMLPAEIPFGFDPLGQPNPAAPQGRLLLLPLMGLGFWTANLIGGAWIYRRQADRPLSYIVWGAGLLIGGLLWGATLLMLASPSV